ncbi:hypothetical protein [Selenomonas sp. FC4001]|uniref:hypothetical protein n=1 Tax=Selenomonas sp. FC4001 TaxID=1408313 RepID=UPI00055DD5C9|nr:hypothetical protein [Selenomonas sp. FC4001]
MIWNLLIGGLAGWSLANYMNSEGNETKKSASTSEKALEMLVNEIRNDAQWAMDICTTNEERDFVYAQVKESLQKLKITLQEKADEIIADLKIQATAPMYDEDNVEVRVKKFKEKMDSLTKTLESMKKSL